MQAIAGAEFACPRQIFDAQHDDHFIGRRDVAIKTDIHDTVLTSQRPLHLAQTEHDQRDRKHHHGNAECAKRGLGSG